jgi:2-(3-amino-3-carboxypropyl)histidine synthase
MYDLEEEKVIKAIKERKAKRILLQFPDGLRIYAFELARKIEELTSAKIIISADPCYGACDLALEELKLFNSDLLIHYGHAKIPKLNEEKILFIEAHAKVSVKPAILKAAEMLKHEEKIGLLAAIQHLNSLTEARNALEDLGKKVYIGDANGKTIYKGQVLGCDFAAAKNIADKIEGFIVISGGNFHGLGVQLATGKKTIVADPFLNEARSLNNLVELTIKKRWIQIFKFSECKNIGVLVSLKTNQLNLELAEKIKKEIENKGKKAVLICVREVTPENLDSFINIEAFVNTGCPRIAIEDQSRFKKPILNPEEALISLGVAPWENYGKTLLKLKESI